MRELFGLGVGALAPLVCVALACSPQGGGDAGVDTTCPSAAPPAGASCAGALACEYGGQSGLCTTVATCKGSAWDVAAPDAGCGQNGASCPPGFASLSPGSACPLAPSDARCVYPEGACACAPCTGDGGASSEWSCRAFGGAPSAGPDCPALRPLLGSPCTKGGAFCAWSCCESVSFGPDETCTNGTWQPAACTAFCPAVPACP